MSSQIEYFVIQTEWNTRILYFRETGEVAFDFIAELHNATRFSSEKEAYETARLLSRESDFSSLVKVRVLKFSVEVVAEHRGVNDR